MSEIYQDEFLRQTLRALFWLGISACVAIGALVVALVVLALRPKLPPYIVAVDHGKIVGYTQTFKGDSELGQEIIIDKIKEFIYDARVVTPNQEFELRNIDTAYAMARGQTTHWLDAHLHGGPDVDPMSLAHKGDWRSVDIARAQRTDRGELPSRMDRELSPALGRPGHQLLGSHVESNNRPAGYPHRPQPDRTVRDRVGHTGGHRGEMTLATIILSLFGTAALSACMTQQPSTPPLVPASFTPAPQVHVPPDPLDSLPTGLREAYLRGSDAPVRDGFAVFIPYREFAAPIVHAAPDHVTEIVLDPSEHIKQAWAGDNLRWAVWPEGNHLRLKACPKGCNTPAGQAAGTSAQVATVPVPTVYSTNLVVDTDHPRTYHFKLVAGALSRANETIAFWFPQDIATAEA